VNQPYCKDLHIYWINRPLKEEEEKLLDDSFIGNWVEEEISFLFFKRDARDELEKLIQKDKGLKIIDYYKMSYEQWQGGFYEPIQIENIIIIPPWQESSFPIPEKSIPIFLDPSVVFGNCLHPTTRHCISAICYFMKRHNAKSILDLGTGTGILAIVSAKLGADMVWAIDINPLCIKTANKNFSRNSVLDKVRSICISAQEAILKFAQADLIIANLNYEVISQLMEIPQFFRNSLILSGMLRSQWADIKYQLTKKGYRIAKEWEEDMTWYSGLALKEVFA